MVSKRKRNHIEKAMGKSKGARQILVSQEEKPTIAESEFTIFPSIAKILRELVIRAREQELNKKQLINSIAYEIEDVLKKGNRPELIEHICTVMFSVLRRNRVNWSIAYLRKVLPEKYKDSVKSRSAASRFQRAGPPGTAPDTGQSAEELEQQLNGRGPAVGQYNTDIEYSEEVRPSHASAFELYLEKSTIMARKGHMVVKQVRIPVIVKIDATKQEPTVYIDMEECNRRVIGR